MNKLAKNAGFILALLTIFSSCASTVKINDDMSPAELIQRAQEASDRNRYKIALQYYEALYDRNRSNLDLVITAEYEIAFIHYKQKKYQQAREELTALLEYYNTPDQELLPQHFKRLAQIVLNTIEEKERQRAGSQNNQSPS
jgi:outer membrane protein assembly factor BamD (BamD/ComL family)